MALAGSRLAYLLAEKQASAAVNPLAPKPPHYKAKAKSVIFLFMDGGPSQIDTFDPKPRLRQDHGKPIPMKTPTTVFNIGDKVSGLALRSSSSTANRAHRSASCFRTSPPASMT